MGDTVDRMVVKEDGVTIAVDSKCGSADIAFLKHTATMVAAYFLSPPIIRKAQHIMSAEMGVNLAKMSLVMGGENGKGGTI